LARYSRQGGDLGNCYFRLCEDGTIVYEGGACELPAQVDEEQLQRLREQVLAVDLEELQSFYSGPAGG
jgi:hypothetical protein